ncbi:MAG TPA: hypothetical protein VIM79_17030 [Niastella sp.]
MAKILFGSFIVLFFNTTLFAQTKGSGIVYPKITLRINNATLDMILDSFHIKYPEYCLYFINNSNSQLRCNFFEVKDASLPEFLKELKRVFPIRGKTPGNWLVISVRQSSQKTTDKTAKATDKRTAPKTITNAYVAHPDTVLIVEKTAPIKKSVPVNAPIINAPPIDPPIQKNDTVSVVCHVKAMPEEVPDSVIKDGIQEIMVRKATGAYYRPFNRSLQDAYSNSNIIDRIFNIYIPLPKNINTAQGTMPGSLRGIVSLYGNKNAHIVLDNFGYHNHTDFINPMDIADVVFIKDAAGGAIWGVNSANGIIALTTKTGTPFNLEINLINSFETWQKPDLDYLAGAGASERIDQEKQAWLQYGNTLMLTPVTDVLTRIKNRVISQTEGDSILNSWRNNNFRQEVKDKFYQAPQRLVNGINVSWGKDRFRLYASLGRDYSLMAEKGKTWNRTTFMTNLQWIDKKIEITLNPSAAVIKSTNNFISLPLNYPYLSLYDHNGNNKAIPWLYSTELTANAVQRGFLPWTFIPADEAALADNRIIQYYYQVNAKLRYNIIKNLYVGAFAQYGYSGYEHYNRHAWASFFTRDLINLYRQRDSAGRYTWPIPVGDIADKEMAVTLFQTQRGQLDYKGVLSDFAISMTSGFERRSQHTAITTGRNYGNDFGYPQSQINYTWLFDMSIYAGERRTIPNGNSRADSITHFLSYFGSLYITWRNMITVSGNFRTDFTNRFSVAVNDKKGIGLCSIGAAWNVGDGLKLRASYGVNGNIDPNASPLPVIQQPVTGSAGVVAIPASPLLRWEKLYIFNAGIDLVNIGKWLCGNIDYYRKYGTDLVHYGAWNPTTGVSVVRNNSGSLTGQGVDCWLRTKPFSLSRQFTFNNDLLVAYSTSKITSADSVLTSVAATIPVTVVSMIQSIYYNAFTFSVQCTGRFGYHTMAPAADQLNIFDVNRAGTVRGDNIKLQQVRLAWELSKKYHPRLPFKKVGVSIAMNNVAILYLQNTRGIDPDVPMGAYPAGRFLNCTIHVTY